MTRSVVFIISLLLLSACNFTGVESTPKVTDKEVQKTINELERQQSSSWLSSRPDSVPAWQKGKQFYVTDDQIRLIMLPESIEKGDSVKLAGSILTYDGEETGSVLDNRATINLHFIDAHKGHWLYRTGKTSDELTSAWRIPLLIDVDMVNHVRSQLRNRDAFILTNLWYDPQDEQLYHARKYVKVTITDVVPGNKVLPLRVNFTSDDGKRAFVWMSAPGATMPGRDFDAMFSLSDPRLSFPSISDETWQLIVQGRVAQGMTKDECRLSMGEPRRINRLPDQTGLREYWHYDGGKYLFFADGLLIGFRQ